MKQTLTLTAGSSNKFWSVETTGCDVTVRYGRNGTKGVSKTTRFATPAEAEAAAVKQRDAKIAKGYEPVDAGAGVGGHPAAGDRTASVPSDDVTPVSPLPPAVEASAPAAPDTSSAPTVFDAADRDDIGLIGTSPFTDGYRIENIPVAAFSNEAADVDAERARFESIAHGVGLQSWNIKSAAWVFDEAPFVDVPPVAVAEAWQMWLFSDPLPNREASAALEDVLTPVLAALNGVEWVLDQKNASTLGAFASRALMPLASDELASAIAARASEPLPPVMVAYDSSPSDDFVHAAILRPGDTEVIAALDAWNPRDHAHGNPSVHDHLGHLLLYPTVPQRVAAFRRWGLEFAQDTKTTTLSAWIHATGREGLTCILDSLEAGSAPFAEGLVELAGAMLTGPGAAAFFIDALTRNGAPAARAWLTRHLGSAATADLDRAGAEALAPFLRELSPTALTGARRHAAPQVARVIDAIADDRALPDVACPQLSETLDAVGASATPTLRQLVTRLPRLRVGEGALGTDETARLLAALAQGLDAPERASLAGALEVLDTASADAFATALLGAWLSSGGPAKSSWMLTEGARLGDLRHVAVLAPLVERWGTTKAARAKQGIDALGANGSDAALSHLLAVTTGRGKPALRAHAKTRMDEAAAARGLDRCQLADRVTPTFGLDAGPRVFSYGERRFAASLDASAKVTVTEIDADDAPVGAPRTALPPARAGEDAEQVRAVKADFSLFKKELTKAVATQAKRYESAMMSGYRWLMRDVVDHIVGHPVLGPVAAQIVWARYEFGIVTATFRFVGGETMDVDGGRVEVPQDAEVGVVHAVELTPQQRDAWILTMLTAGGAAPFQQCERPIFTLTEEGAENVQLPGVPTREIAATSLVGLLARHGFERGPSVDAGLAFQYGLRAESADLTILITHGGIPTSAPHEHPPIRILNVVPVRGLLDPRELDEPEAFGERLVPWKHVPASVTSEVLAMLDATLATAPDEERS
ncbi:DUF4132 domain-containing protein [Dermacoccus sp. Ellin185]|uniref:DUF4132 domain-containing protein n=1 Tax=Dermacoccus sp. Ellin185 TaxID=188626 RepID=UPI0001E63B81|nr:DUF4132 domain-containing protein [Dermacoccus sp. Ellin185]EFP58221.1 WGR domain protein [Dermacoccus sp. Ellin185]